MRRFVPIALVALLTIGLVSPVAARGRPDIEDQVPLQEMFAGFCAFPVELRDSFAAGKFFTFPIGGDGSQLIASAGGYMSTLTNRDEPSMSVDISFFGRGEFLFNADGTIRFRLAGQAFTAVAGPEAEMMGLAPGIYLIKGRLEILYDKNFEALAVTKNRLVVRDLCAELTPSS